MTHKDLLRLARELAQLGPDERAVVVAEAARHGRSAPPPATPSLPLLTGGTEWIGGDLRREELYGDDGR